MSTSSKKHSSRSSSVSSTSSTSSTSHTPQHPPKHTPNPHPYPIKTTSTALLTRSNSSNSQNGGRHYYVPLARPASRSGSVSGEDGESDSGISGEHQREGKEHKYTRSLTDAPSPLPIPPSPSASPSSHIRARYSDSPSKSEFKPPPPEIEGDDRENLKMTLEGLPPNPRDWSKGELGTYLKAALRAQSANGQGVHFPPRLVLDITQWVREQGMNGRSFVRLGENELGGMHLSTLWRNSLLSALRYLRQNVLKDKIWVDSSSPMGSYISQSQADSTDLEGLPLDATEELAPNLGSISRSGGKKYRTVGRSQGRAHARGKVRGIVENWERSGSESEDGGEGRESSKLGVQTEGVERSTSGDTQYYTAPHTPYDVQLPPKVDTMGENKEEPSMQDLLKTEGKGSKHDSWGARAWEEFDAAGSDNGVGVTVKHIPPEAATRGVRRISGDGVGVFAHEEDDNESAVTGWEEDVVLPPTMKHIFGVKGSVKGKGSVNGKEKDERRIVTAIFNADPAPSSTKLSSTTIPSPPPFEVYSSSAGDLMSTPGVLPEDPTGGKPRSRRPSTPAELRHHLGIGPMAKIENEKEQQMDDELMGELASAAKKAEAREKVENRANSFSSPDRPSKPTVTAKRAKSFSSAHQPLRMAPMGRTSSFSSNQRLTSIGMSSSPHNDPFSSSAGDLITTEDALPEDPTAGKPRSRRPSTPAELKIYLGIGPLAKLEREREKEIDNEFMSELISAVKRAEEKGEEEEIERVAREKKEERIREQEERKRKAELEGVRMALERAKLEDDVRANRALLAEFGRRLEDVESKIEAIERAQEEEQKNKSQLHLQPSTSTTLVSRALSYLYPSSTEANPGATPNGERPGGPPVSALPSYVLLVSIGMCAVVLRVVLKRVTKGAKA